MNGSVVWVKTHHASMLRYLGHLMRRSGVLAWSRLHWHDHIWPTCLEAQDVGQALSMGLLRSHHFFILWNSSLLSTRKEPSLRPQVMELLQIEDRGLSEEVVFPNILLVVAVLHLLLVDIVNEFLYLVLGVSG